MSLRETINRNPRIAIGASALLFVAMAGMLIYNLSGSRIGAGSNGPKAWYTADDGKTWFADAANRIVPFDHEGRPAYRCAVWTCDDGKTQFVSHLERLNPDTLASVEGKTTLERWEMLPGMEQVKPPLTGDRGWLDLRSPQSQELLKPKCPEGGGVPKRVRPG